MRLFYDHLVDRKGLSSLINEASSPKERVKLMKLIDETIHNTVLDVIFSHLDEKNHEEFLVMLHKEPHAAGILVYLKEKAHPQIEEKIREKVEDLRDKLISEMRM